MALSPRFLTRITKEDPSRKRKVPLLTWTSSTTKSTPACVPSTEGFFKSFANFSATTADAFAPSEVMKVLMRDWSADIIQAVKASGIQRSVEVCDCAIFCAIAFSTAGFAGISINAKMLFNTTNESLSFNNPFAKIAFAPASVRGNTWTACLRTAALGCLNAFVITESGNAPKPSKVLSAWIAPGARPISSVLAVWTNLIKAGTTSLFPRSTNNRWAVKRQNKFEFDSALMQFSGVLKSKGT